MAAGRTAVSSTTLFSSTSSTSLLQNGAHDRRRVREVREHRGGIAREKIIHRIPPRRNSDCPRADAAAAAHCGWRVADDAEFPSLHWMSEHRLRASPRDGRQLRARGVIRSKSPYAKAMVRDPNCGKLRHCALAHVAGKEAQYDVVAIVERIQQRSDARIRVPFEVHAREFVLKQRHVPRDGVIKALLDDVLGNAYGSRELPHDLRVGLSVEANALCRSRAVRLANGTMHGAQCGTSRPQQRTIDVEQNDLHSTATTASRPGRRVSNSPPTMHAPPASCVARGVSDRNAHAAAIANSGCRFEDIAARVGPRTRMPRYQNRYAMTSAMMLLYAMAAQPMTLTLLQSVFIREGVATTSMAAMPPVIVTAEMARPSTCPVHGFR